MTVKLQIIQASVVSLLPALNTILISLFWDLSSSCSFSEKDSFLGLQQALLGVETGHELGFIDLLLCHGGVCILNQKVPPAPCPLLSGLLNFCQLFFVCLADSFFTRSYLKTVFPFGMICMVIY